MKIISFEAQDFMRLTAMQIHPKGHVVELNGKNGNGKTSVLRAIASAFGGADESPDMAIRRGADKAKVKISIGDDVTGYTVEETFHKHKTTGAEVRTVRVFSKDGAEYKSPQQLLGSLWNKISIDPLQFAESDAKDQYKQLQQFVPGFDFAGTASKRALLYSQRTEAGRLAREQKALADAATAPDVDMSTAPANEADLVAQLEGAGKHNASITERRGNRDRAQENIKAWLANADDIANAGVTQIKDAYERKVEQQMLDHQRKLKALEDERDRDVAAAKEAESALRARAADMEKKIADAGPLPEPIDTAELVQRIATNKELASAQAQRRRKDELTQKAKDAEEKVTALTAEIDALDAAKVAAITGAAMPVPGLGFGDGCVTFNGVPFSQASDAERLRVSLAIAMAASPKLRVIRIQRGSLLDDDSMAIIGEMVKEKDYQVWIEKIQSTDGNVGFVIEDGTVVGMSGDDKGEG